MLRTADVESTEERRDERDGTETASSALVKASIAHVATGEALEVLWNPSRYRIERRRHVHVPAALGGAGAVPQAVVASGREERFETALFVDTTDRPAGPGRDARRLVDRLAGWMGAGGPEQVVFVWGPFRFAGFIEALDEEWIRFDADGTPVRAWVALTLRR